jgi:hypothetical protein
MAEEKAAGAPALDTNIETGGFDEKRGQAPPATHNPKAPVADDEEPDEDMDALIEDLESEDGHEIDDEEETTPGGGRVVPEDQLQTDSRVGLTEAEVIARRKKWGLNAMKEERENMILKFLMFFVGPIQFVMVRFILFFFPFTFSHPCFAFLRSPSIFKYYLSLRFFSSMFRSSAISPRFFYTQEDDSGVVLGEWRSLATYMICLHGPWLQPRFYSLIPHFSILSLNTVVSSQNHRDISLTPYIGSRRRSCCWSGGLDRFRCHLRSSPS